MRIVVTGATGFIGKSLLQALIAGGHEVVALTRRPRPAGTVRYVVWDGQNVGPWATEIDGADAVIHLAGDPVAEGRWTAQKKIRIRQSRVEGTQAIVAAIAQAKQRPKVLISGSATGYYGPHGSERITEDTPPGHDFLAEVCTSWETAAQMVQACGVRLVLLRTGIVLGRDGGALAKLLPVFRLGLGGALGSGQQGFPWIDMSDEIGLILWALTNEAVSGPLNATAPVPVSNAVFTRTLNQALGRPGFLPVPAFALKLALGEQAEMLLGGAHVFPQKALDLGYTFRYPTLADSLQALLSPPGSEAGSDGA